MSLGLGLGRWLLLARQPVGGSSRVLVEDPRFVSHHQIGQEVLLLGAEEEGLADRHVGGAVGCAQLVGGPSCQNSHVAEGEEPVVDGGVGVAECLLHFPRAGMRVVLQVAEQLAVFQLDRPARAIAVFQTCIAGGKTLEPATHGGMADSTLAQCVVDVVGRLPRAAAPPVLVEDDSSNSVVVHTSRNREGGVRSRPFIVLT